MGFLLVVVQESTKLMERERKRRRISFSGFFVVRAEV